MRICVVKETKQAERRVALTAAAARSLTLDGHQVLIETGAGAGAGIADEAYEAAGAKLAATADAWDAELVVKVKEPTPAEYRYLRQESTLFTYLHLAADPGLTQALVQNKVTAIAYETVVDEAGELPLLKPMSEIAGRLAAHAAAHYLTQPAGGPGLLLSGSPGVAPAQVVIIGGGVVGTQAALIAVGMRADVTIIEVSARRVRQLEELFGMTARVRHAEASDPSLPLEAADVIIGAVLVPGAAAPQVLSREDLDRLAPGALLIDVAIDQGGCFETSRPTTYEHPTFTEEGVRHYCVANMPGAVPRTSTTALTNATWPFIHQIASLGVQPALDRVPGLSEGLNTRAGKITHPAVAAAIG